MDIKPTTMHVIECIQYIKENKEYLQIGIIKYKENFNMSIAKITNILQCDILTTSLEKIINVIDSINGIDYMSVVEEISILREKLGSIVLEEKEPILPKLNKAFEEER